MTTAELQRLRDIHAEVTRLRRGLNRTGYDIPALEPAISQAREGIDRLEKWTDELVYIAETELQPRRGRPPRTE